MRARDFARFLELAEGSTPRPPASTRAEDAAATELGHVEASIAWTRALLDDIANRAPRTADRGFRIRAD
jgi:hypothetical protein